jgi:hypothetical protein
MPRHLYVVLILALALVACAVPPAAVPTTNAEPTAAEAATVVLPTATDTPPSATPAPPSATPAPTDAPQTAAPTEQATSAPRTPSPAATTPSAPAASPTAALFVDPTATPGAPAPTVAPTSATSAPPVAGSQPGGGSSAAAQPNARQAPATGKPVRLVIDGIDLDRSLVPVGLDANRLPIVPDHDIGWYTLGAQPGQGENVVLWGHVLRFRRTPNIPAPFARLKELKKGDAVTLYDARGTPYKYVVTEQVWATPDQIEYMLPRGREQVTMISCIGDKVVEDGSVEMTHRLITIAEPDR